MNDMQTYVFVGDVAVGSKLTSSLAAAGFVAANGLSTADVVFTYHENQSGLEDVYFDSPGLLQDTKEGAILVDLSPTTPSFAQELHAVASVNDRFAVDAPLVVRDIVAADAFADPENLFMFVGAESDIYDRVEPLLSAIASRVMWAGAPGCGQSAKVASTLQNASSIIGIIETYVAFTTSGVSLDGEDYLDLMESTGCMAPMHSAFVEALRGESFAGTYTVEIMMGELAAALSAADDKDTIFPQAEAGFHLLELLALVGGAGYNPAALSLVFADEDTCKRYELDWSRAEGTYADEEGCSCGHDHDHEHGHECCGQHDHGDGSSDDFIGFSSN